MYEGIVRKCYLSLDSLKRPACNNDLSKICIFWETFARNINQECESASEEAQINQKENITNLPTNLSNSG